MIWKTKLIESCPKCPKCKLPMKFEQSHVSMKKGVDGIPCFVNHGDDYYRCFKCCNLYLCKEAK